MSTRTSFRLRRRDMRAQIAAALGPDLLIDGDPDLIEELSRQFSAVQQKRDGANSNLDDIARRGVDWTGEAANAFVDTLNGLPGYLSQFAAAYGRVGWALWEYVNDNQMGLRQLQSSSVVIGDQLLSAEQTLDRLKMRRAASVDPAEQASLDSSIQVTLRDINAYRTAANALHEEWRSHAITTCVSRIRDAQSMLGADLGSIWQNVVDSPVGQTVEIVAHIVRSTFEHIVNLPHDLEDWLAHPTDLARLSKVLADASAVLTVAGLLLAIAGAVFTGGASLAAMAVILMWANAGLAVAQLGVDAGRMAEGDKRVGWIDIGLDAVGVATSVVHLHAQDVEDAAKTSAADAKFWQREAEFADPETIMTADIAASAEEQATLDQAAAVQWHGLSKTGDKIDYVLAGKGAAQDDRPPVLYRDLSAALASYQEGRG